MSIALLGKGKTGSKVLELSQNVEVFDSKNVPTAERLMKHDVIISFLPGDVFASMIPLLLETKKPVVTGSTGFKWPADLHKTLQEKDVAWIYATNFSLGVVVLKQLIDRLNQVSSIFKEKTFTIHEVHHEKKLDAPSGTALSMKEWLDFPSVVTSDRFGDVIGLHILDLETPGEVIRIEHEAKDRKLFAEGALWAANYILKNKLNSGLHPFQSVVESHLSL